MSRLQELTSKYSTLRDKSIRIRSTKESLSNQLQQATEDELSHESDLFLLREQETTQSLSIEAMKQLISALSTEHINKLTSILNQALKAIFIDRDYQVKIELSEKRNSKSAEFTLVENQAQTSFDSIGGGILSVVGLVLRIFYISHYNLRPVLFIDESLSQISSQYLVPTVQFLEQLSARGFIFISVTHDPRLQPYATTHHTVNLGVVKEEVL